MCHLNAHLSLHAMIVDLVNFCHSLSSDVGQISFEIRRKKITYFLREQPDMLPVVKAFNENCQTSDRGERCIRKKMRRNKRSALISINILSSSLICHPLP